MLNTAVRNNHNPMVTIADSEFDRLDALAWAGGLSENPVAEFLAAELDRAVIRPADAIGPNVVRMNSRVAFRIGDRPGVEVRTLVYPEVYAQQADRNDYLSVMTPLGAALIGLRVGSRISYETGNGTQQDVTVEAVLHQSDRADHGSAGDNVERDDIDAPVSNRIVAWSDDDPGPTAA